ncbi:hypothetical protein BX592_1558, partial [Paraburkholderia rhizosphaerae]
MSRSVSAPRVSRTERMQPHNHWLRRAAESRLTRSTPFDWLFALALVAGAGFALTRYHPFMNYYDKLVLVCAVPVFVVLG